MPIGNLTSQILANIYLNEFDRFVVHRLKPIAYVRYGDDFLCFGRSKKELDKIRAATGVFLQAELNLRINPKVDKLQPAYKGIDYLGVNIWPDGRRLQLKVRWRMNQRLNRVSMASYRALVKAHERPKYLKNLDWRLLEQNEV